MPEIDVLVFVHCLGIIAILGYFAVPKLPNRFRDTANSILLWLTVIVSILMIVYAILSNNLN